MNRRNRSPRRISSRAASCARTSRFSHQHTTASTLPSPEKHPSGVRPLLSRHCSPGIARRSFSLMNESNAVKPSAATERCAEGLMWEGEVDMSPIKQAAVGIGGCVLVPGGNLYRLQNGAQTYDVAVTASLVLPSLHCARGRSPNLCAATRRPRRGNSNAEPLLRSTAMN
jgi:hypothetical protein